jgi:hypothetical protein
VRAHEAKRPAFAGPRNCEGDRGDNGNDCGNPPKSQPPLQPAAIYQYIRIKGHAFAST